MARDYVSYAEGLNTKKSWSLYERASKVMPGGASSHGQCYPVFDPYPLTFEKGRGSHIWDADGNEYIDFILSMGPCILGHCHPTLMKAAADQLKKGTAFAVLNENEVKLAELVCKIVPNAEMVRFSNSGAEATMSAIRFARAYTGKTKIIKFEGAYHGAYDQVMVGFGGVQPVGPAMARVNTPVSWGVPEEVLSTVIQLPWNDLSVVEKTLKRRSHEIAAIITEPVLMNIGTVLPEEGYLNGLQELCHKYDVVFILDEVISGFRLALGGAQEYFNLRPDLATYAKALGAGFPISAITGKREIMENVVPGKMMHSGTYNANPLVVTAALASLTELSRNNGAIYKHLNKIGTMLMEGLQDAVDETKTKGMVQGIGSGGCQLYFTDRKKISNYKDFFSTDSTKYMKFHKQLLKRGVYFHPQQYEHLFVCTAHTEKDVDTAVSSAREVLKQLA
ncbi:MAG: glutamate-1-semialdehyde 2,1-aminomutase [Nitrososphaerota archaeon]|nr:glutamate-1-semialdehyde 2,1-aminomutase [Nitrososphaerota archaeon]